MNPGELFLNSPFYFNIEGFAGWRLILEEKLSLSACSVIDRNTELRKRVK
jgi:hypothetical protein